MPSYDAEHYDPPAPVVHVTLRSQRNGKTVLNVPVLLDTGADVTLLPHAAVERLDVPIASEPRYELMGFDGSRSFTPAVTLDLHFLKQVFRGQYLLTEEDHGIMGRDILNHVLLLLDGPRQQWSEHVAVE